MFRRLVLASLLVIVVLHLASFAAAAEPSGSIVLGDEVDRVRVVDMARVLADPNHKWTVGDGDLLWREAFPKSHPVVDPMLEGPAGRHWVFIDIENQSTEEEWVLSFHLPGIDTLATVLYSPEDGEVNRRVTGRSYDARNRDFPVIGHHLRTKLEAGGRYRLAILFESSSPPHPNLSELELQTHPAFISQAARLNISILFSLGLIATLGLYMLFLWARLRERTYLWFGGYALSTVLLWSTHYELFRLVLFPRNDSPLANYMATAAMVIFILLFTRNFLRLSEIAPRLTRVFGGGIAAAIMLLGAIPLIDTASVAYHLNASLAGVALLLVAAGAVVAVRARVASSRLFLAAFLLIFVGASMTVLDALFLSLPTATVRLLTVVFTSVGVLTMALSVANQIHGLKRGIFDAEKLARTDRLTGVYNRTAFEVDIEKLARKIRMKEEGDLTIVFADLDGLKLINDNSGHQLGDDMLRAFAGALQRRVRDGDEIYRIGGDEFVVLMPHSEVNPELSWLAGRFEDIVDELHTTGYSAFGVSIGIAHLSEVDGDTKMALKLADQRMYETKERRKRLRITS